MIEIFIILKYFYNSDPNEILQRHTSNATRGHSLMLQRSKATLISGYIASQIEYNNNWNNLSNHVVSSSKTDLTHTGKTTQLDLTGKQVTTSILVLAILIINAEKKRSNMTAPRIYHKVVHCGAPWYHQQRYGQY